MSDEPAPTTSREAYHDGALRELLGRLLDWQDAHVRFDDAVDGIPPELQGVRPRSLPYSAWQLVEHIRVTQRDILDFCRDTDYEEPRWPQDYWPTSPVPPRGDSWDGSIAAFREDRAALKSLAKDAGLDLFASIPHGAGQTYLRELLLVADHNAYHIGQLVLVRRLLGVWGSG